MKPLRRHLLLWLGLLPGIFILWGWVDSTRYLTRVDMDIRGRSVNLRQSEHTLVIGFTHALYPLASWELHRFPARYHRGIRIWQGEFDFETKELDPFYGVTGKVTHLIIPHSMLFSAWLLLYASALLFHARAIRREACAHPADARLHP